MLREKARNVTIIDLLRHGACEGGEIYRGSTDVALNEQGWQQMEEAVATQIAANGAAPWQRIVSSPLQRCKRFAEAQAERMSLPLHIEDAFKEMHFGDWEGRLLTEVYRENPESVAAFYQQPDIVAPPNGETIAQLQARMLPALHSLLADYEGEHLLLIQHGVSIRALLSWVLDIPLAKVSRIDIPYAGFSRLQVYHHGAEHVPRLVFMNHSYAGE